MNALPGDERQENGGWMAINTSGPQVLVVDDEAALVDLICNMLKMARITAEPCPLGTQALPYIRRTKPQLVILDVMMPDVDGLTLFGQLRADPATAPIPILLMTAGSTHVVDTLPHFHHNHDAFLPKPFRVHTMINTVRAMLRGSVPNY
jgi:DNA-binding response OmpR family regulator